MGPFVGVRSPLRVRQAGADLPNDFLIARKVCPEGPEGAHLIENHTDETCRVLLLSSKASHAFIHYPDSGKVGIWSQAGGYEAMLRTEPNLDYWDGE